MSDDAPERGFCPDCGAENAVSARACWMCGRTAWGAGPAATGRGTSSPAEIHTGQFVATDAAQTAPQRDAGLMRWVLPGVAVLVIAGVAAHSPGLAMLLTLVVGIPLLITVATARSRDARYRAALEKGALAGMGVAAVPSETRPMSSGDKAGMFLKWVAISASSVLVTFAIVVVAAAVMVLSLVVALFTACAQLLQMPGAS